MDIYNLGKYNEGLTKSEIEEYLLIRLREKLPDTHFYTCPQPLIDKFNKIAKEDIHSIKIINGKYNVLIHRYDVKRITDTIFRNKK